MLPVFVINMKKDVIKKAQMERQLRQQDNLTVTYIDAVEGKKLTDAELKNLADMRRFRQRYNSFATLPALGCSLSHLRTYDLIAEQDIIDYALIIEDDAILCNNLNSELQPVIKFIKERSAEPTAILLTPDFYYNKSNLIRDDASSKQIFRLSGGYMTSGYLINRAGCHLLANKLKPVSYLADAWSDFCRMGLHLYGVIPHLISYSNELGEIGRSQHQQVRSYYQYIRYRLANIKGAFSRLMAYSKGIRRARKQW